MSRREREQEKSGERNKQHETELQDEEQFRQLLGVHLEKWDSGIEPGIPTDEAMMALVRGHKQETRERFRRELLLFWLVSIFVLSGMFLLWMNSVVLFAVVQAIAVAVGVIVAGGLAIAKKHQGEGRRHRWSGGK
ncbi:YxlC family protein [Paenibacillus montanisoli]|uniref:Uncharacterized protein n=1 Tax=Paenibacillus montanisoli TaxID=2081970 RepID=A0A328TTI7_9BACL|nr:YxlC family protein [Paenibacillus montanisoli]RAP73848.1 hypothetical protein DL346_26755 [Paenibacillus montanisoli]